jgi:hypothetical protein
MSTMEILRKLRATEEDLFEKFTEMRRQRIAMESELFGNSLTAFAGNIRSGGHTVVKTPFELAAILAKWIKEVRGTVLEYSETSKTLQRWMTTEKHSPTITFEFEGDATDFINNTIVALKDELEKIGVSWRRSGDGGWPVFHNKKLVLNQLAPILRKVVKK